MIKIFSRVYIIIFIAIMSCNGAVENASIDTPTIQCGMCQSTIEKGLGKIIGVEKSKVDLKKKTTDVTYNPEKIGLNGIERAISELGYQANQLKADPLAYDALYPCCKIGGMEKK